jgi:hypothetical protein
VNDELNNLHGRAKEPEADDPMELVMVSLPAGDPELMATCLIEEYARLGFNEDEILELFRQPLYHIHFLYCEKGEAWVRVRIQEVLARTGRMRVSVTVLHQIGGCDA